MTTPSPRPSEKPRSFAEARVRELLEQLRLVVHYAPATQRQIEHKAGFSKGYLSQILRGHSEIKLSHVLAVIHALDLSPADFFAELFGERRYAASSLRSPSRRPSGEGSRLGLELARLYGIGIESLDDFVQRLEACEGAFRELEDAGYVDLEAEASATTNDRSDAGQAETPAPVADIRWFRRSSPDAETNCERDETIPEKKRTVLDSVAEVATAPGAAPDGDGHDGEDSSMAS
jgi:transcriptional regulator with XRE-family HTH domain